MAAGETEVDQYRQLRPTDVDTLLISGDLDFATPAEFATKELLPTLRNGHQVELHNLGHSADTWSYEKPASNRLIIQRSSTPGTWTRAGTRRGR